MRSAAAAAAFLTGGQGLASCRDLRLAGVDGRWIRGQIQRGLWMEVFPGVVDTTGSPLTSARRIAAACLAAGPDSLIAGLTAVGVYGLAPLAALEDDIHVRIPHGAHRVNKPGIVIHQDRHPVGTHFIGGIPVVSPATLLAQLADTVNDNDLRCVAAEAVNLELVTIDGMLTQTRPSRRAARKLRMVAEELQAGAISGGEARYWRAAKERGLPLPELNALVRTGLGDKYVDGLWRRYGLGYEIDGRSVHGHERAFVADRRRYNAIQVESLVLMHFAVSDVFVHTHEVMDTTEEFLRMRALERGLPWPPGARTR